MQTRMEDTEEGWESGIEKRCVLGAGACRMQPCTVASGVTCCGRCGNRKTCVSRCDISRAKRNRS